MITTLMSCRIRMAIMMRPCTVLSSPRSISILSTMDVLLSEMIRPKMNDCSSVQ